MQSSIINTSKVKHMDNLINDKIAIIILTYNSAKWIPFCLESLKPYYKRSDVEIILVDNASHDNTIDTVKGLNLQIRLIELKENIGCAGGNNVGWRATDAEYVVFLNPDVWVTVGWLDSLVAPLKTMLNVAVSGCKLYYPNSHIIQHAGGILYPNAMCDHFGNGEEENGKYDDDKFVDFVTGAAFAVKNSLLRELDGFDEDFFPAYYEETDFCMRARKKGLKILYRASAVAYHYESSSLTKLSENFYRTFYKSRILFLVKHYSLSDWLTKFLPFEIKWMLFEPKARETRLKQFRAYLYLPHFIFHKNKTPRRNF